ncbi:hypothetical protein FBR05_05670 [Deltaproteobacteria bacterium PRO3]|nr:hypothetical protein [Deltaproteobacteria bacterium PRO3]
MRFKSIGLEWAVTAFLLGVVSAHAAPPDQKQNIYNVFQSVQTQTQTKPTTTVNPNLLNATQPLTRLPKFVLTPPASVCLFNPVDAPDRTLRTICRSIMKCIAFPGGRTVTPEIQEELADTCVRDLAEGEARQLWNNLGYEPENTFTTSQMREEITSGRATVNVTGFCNCMNSIANQSCETIEGLISTPTDYANFENLIPETPDCESVFGP